jgi:hypothetical protein
MASNDLDYRAFYDATYIRAWDLPPGKDVAVLIDRVEGETIKGVDKEDRRPVIYFAGKKKGLVLNKGMGKTIKGMYGRFVRDWIGKPIALYATSVNAFGETHDVVRVRPSPPKRQRATAPQAPAPALPAASIPDAEYEETPVDHEVAS